MTWAVVVALFGVLVTAGLGAVGAAREQSAMRQLERVSAVLKDVPADAEARSHLEWLRDALAKRVNAQYRAPRNLTDRYGAWLLTIIGFGAGIAGWVGWLVVMSPNIDPMQPWLLVVVAVVGLGLETVGVFRLVQLWAERKDWAEKADPSESHAPLV